MRWTGSSAGAMVLAGFGLLWWVVGTGSLGDWSLPLRTAGLIFGILLLALIGWRGRRATVDPPDLPERGLQRFDLIVFAEAAVVVLVVVLGNVFGVFPVVPALIALVVGLFFFPLARLFGGPYLLLGVLMTLLGVGSLIVLPWLGKIAPFAVPGIGAAVLFWAASMLMVRTAGGSPAGPQRAADPTP